MHVLTGIPAAGRLIEGISLLRTFTVPGADGRRGIRPEFSTLGEKHFSMTNPTSGRGAGPRIPATVKWYDPAKGYGFLVPDDGSPDLFCRAQVLTAVGLDNLLPGAAVACEAAPGPRGPEVSRILSVDFSTAAPRTVSPARPSGNGQVAVGSGGSEVYGGPVRAIVKWFHADKGYGFLEPEDGSADLFCHLSAVQASGHDTLPQGAAVTCMIVQGDRGPQVSRVLSVEPAIAGPARSPGSRSGAGSLGPGGPADRSRSFGSFYPDARAAAPAAAVAELPGTVKFFDPARGFGFVVPDEGGREVFVHSSVLFRSGMTDLEPGQRVFVRAESVPRGLQATQIEPL